MAFLVNKLFGEKFPKKWGCLRGPPRIHKMLKLFFKKKKLYMFLFCLNKMDNVIFCQNSIEKFSNKIKES